MSIQKLAVTQYPLHELIVRRWSPRAFADRGVEPATLARLLEAARWADSCFNEQPWRYLVATKENPAEFKRMLECLVEGNQVWAKHAPVLMISVAKLAFAHDGKPNRHAFHDVGAASAFLTFQATALGLYVHQMGGIYVDRARETYAIPEGFEAVAGIALGYLGDPQSLSEPMRTRELEPSKRQPLEAMVFGGRWGEKFPLVK
jgi:nitroreductase